MTYIVCDDEDAQRQRIRRMIKDVYPEARIIECRSAKDVLSSSDSSRVILMDTDTEDGPDGMDVVRILL